MLDQEIKNKYERRIRRLLLERLNSARPEGLRGGFIFDTIENNPEFADLVNDSVLDGKAVLVQLLGDLCALTFVEVKDTRELRHEKRDLDHLHYKITADGTALLAMQKPKNGLVEDPRI